MPNYLIDEQSLYLQQHAHNPVEWYPWCDKAFERARLENKPVLVSIGYASCHWCHVMEHESFEDPQTAALMNQFFINIKVDREEHPEVDEYMMNAVQSMTGSGGWPLNVFVTPDKLPFYGGTYFPPKPLYNRASWTQVLQRIHDIWTQKPDEVQSQAQQMLAYLTNAAQVPELNSKENLFDEDTLHLVQKNLLQQADSEYGGFGGAPKFPSIMALQFLLEHYHFTKNKASWQHLELSLQKMLQSGIYDVIGGGLCRYSVDAQWQIPHFEKMLYDNAQFLSLLCDVYKVKPNDFYKEKIQEILDFLLSEMYLPKYGFYSAIDADSEGHEGKYYIWSYAEFEAIATQFSPQYAPYFIYYFALSKEGNFEEKNILNTPLDLEAFSLKYQLQNTDFKATLTQFKKHLKALRAARVRPLTDDKILLSWNALMNIALTKAACILQETSIFTLAKQHLDGLLQAFEIEQQPKHCWIKGQSKQHANLEDLSYLISALIQGSMVLEEEAYLHKAVQLCQFTIEHFQIPDHSMFYFSAKTQKELPLNKAQLYDGVHPSSNAVMAHNLHLLGILTENPAWIAQGETLVSLMLSSMKHYPLSFSYWSVIALRMMKQYKKLEIPLEHKAQLKPLFEKKFSPEQYYFFEKEENFVTMPFGNEFKKKTQILVCTKNKCFPISPELPENLDFAIL